MITFLNLWYLAALSAIAVPVLIHILQRDRIRRIKFPATRFLLEASRKITRKQTLREWLLLMIRSAVVAVLALAVARPLWINWQKKSAQEFAGADLKATVLLVDISASMRSGKRMDEARTQAQAFLTTLRPGMDHVSLLTFDENINELVPLSDEIKPASEALKTVTAGYGAGDLAAALKHANRLLQAEDVRNYAREIVVFSDLQRSGWTHYQGDWTLSPGVTLTVKPVTLIPLENVAITNISIPASVLASPQPETLSVQVTNYSFRERPDSKVTLTVGGKIIDEKNLNLRPNRTELVSFRYSFNHPGDAAGSVAVESDDDFKEDNTWFFNVRVLPLVNILLVNGSLKNNAANDDGYFLKSALTIPGSPFLLREIQPSALTPDDFKNMQAVIFTDVGELPAQLLAALKNFVASGKSLMFFLGNHVEPETFNRAFAGLTPCRLQKKIFQAIKSEGVSIGEVELQHPIFERFSTPQSGDFSAAKFTKYCAVSDSQSSKILARYTDGTPALLEKNFDKGHVLLFTSSAGIQWNNFCLNGGVFVPFIHESLKYLAVHCESQTMEHPTVNIPRAESEVPLLEAQELSVVLASQPNGHFKEIEGVQVWVAASTTTRERIEAEQHIGWYLLIAVLGMLMGEHLLANSASRRS